MKIDKKSNDIKLCIKTYNKFVCILEKNFCEDTEKKIKIQIIEHSVQSDLSFKKDIRSNFIFSSQLISSKKLLFIILSHSLVDQFLECLFGKYKFTSQHKKNKSISSSKKYILKKLINIIITSYNQIFNTSDILYKKYFFYDTIMNCDTLKQSSHTLYLVTDFLCEYQSIKTSFSCKIPMIDFHKIIYQYENSINLKKINHEKNHSAQILLQHIYNIKLNLVVKLEKNIFLLKHVKNLKVGNIFIIDPPKIVVAYTHNKIPILLGEYCSNGYRTVLYITKNFLNPV